MLGFFTSHGPVLTDGVIDLRPIVLPDPVQEVHFGVIKNFRITLHNHRREIGQISLRLGESVGIYYFGHIGYHIDPPWRGHHYAARACMLLKSDIRQYGKESVVITTDPDNEASRRTCERIGAIQERTMRVPAVYQREWQLSSEKVRYIWKMKP